MRYLVVGCGSIGSRHLRNLRTLGVAELAACEPHVERADRLRHEFDGPIFRTLDRALDWCPTAVLVCTPTDQHLPVARRALAAGAHLFIEKPLGLMVGDATRFVAEIEGTNRAVLVACNMRFHTGVQRLKDILDSGTLGRVAIIRARFGHYLPNWRPGRDYRSTYSVRGEEGGGILLEGVHEIDYVSWIGGPVVDLAAHEARAGELEVDVEDVARLWLRFAGGAIGEIQLDYLAPVKDRGCEIIGTRGAARWTSEGKNPEVLRVDMCELPETRWRRVHADDAYNGNLMYLAEMRHFLDCVGGAATPLLDARGAAEVLALAARARTAGSVARSGVSSIAPVIPT